MATVESYIRGWIGTYVEPTEELVERLAKGFPFDRGREITPLVRDVLESLDEDHRTPEALIREELSTAVDEDFADVVAPPLAEHKATAGLKVGAEETIPSPIQLIVGSWVWDDINAGRLDPLKDIYERRGKDALRDAVERWVEQQ